MLLRMPSKPTQMHLHIIRENKGKSLPTLRLHIQRVDEIKHNNKNSTQHWWGCWYLEFWYIDGGIRWLSKDVWECLWRAKHVWYPRSRDFSPVHGFEWVGSACSHKYVDIHGGFIKMTHNWKFSSFGDSSFLCVWGFKLFLRPDFCSFAFARFENNSLWIFISGSFYCLCLRIYRSLLLH